MCVMRTDLYVKIVLTAIAVLLVAIALRPAAAVHAQGGRDLYIEPGYTMLRKPDGSAQVQGKVVIDLQSGDIYGFPTLVSGPYPMDPASSMPPVSKPMYLGRFDFDSMSAPRH